MMSIVKLLWAKAECSNIQVEIKLFYRYCLIVPLANIAQNLIILMKMRHTKKH